MHGYCYNQEQYDDVSDPDNGDALDLSPSEAMVSFLLALFAAQRRGLDHTGKNKNLTSSRMKSSDRITPAFATGI